MTFPSVDLLQKTLADKVFHYAPDKKKAAGRALGTLVELITYYTLRAWGLGGNIVIERSIPEYANPEITHNVEFSLHPIVRHHSVKIDPLSLPITPAKIMRQLSLLDSRLRKTNVLLTRDIVKRNSCVLADDELGIVVAHLDKFDETSALLGVNELLPAPFAIFECKRVGIEEGMKKGPQTIEKAKQGAYVARSVSALQKVRKRNGQFYGVVERADGGFRSEPYAALVQKLIKSNKAEELRGFILTVGVASNHGNWFTSQNANKELKVLAQSYDWLLFLTDMGLSRFIERLLLEPTEELAPAREAFLASYTGKSGNQFTKVRIGTLADEALRRYFSEREREVESWYNVIAPGGRTIGDLQSDLNSLAAKNWTEIFKP